MDANIVPGIMFSEQREETGGAAGVCRDSQVERESTHRFK